MVWCVDIIVFLAAKDSIEVIKLNLCVLCYLSSSCMFLPLPVKTVREAKELGVQRVRLVQYIRFDSCKSECSVN